MSQRDEAQKIAGAFSATRATINPPFGPDVLYRYACGLAISLPVDELTDADKRRAVAEAMIESDAA